MAFMLIEVVTPKAGISTPTGSQGQRRACCAQLECKESVVYVLYLTHCTAHTPHTQTHPYVRVCVRVWVDGEAGGGI